MAIKSQIYTVSSLKLAQKIKKTRPSFNNAKDWLDQFFPFPGLEMGFTYGCDLWGQSTTILLCIRPFSANKQQGFILVQACSPVRSLLQKKAPVHSCRVRVMELWSTLCCVFFILRIADNLVSPPTMHLSALSIPHHSIPSTRLSPNPLENFEANSHLCLFPY